MLEVTDLRGLSPEEYRSLRPETLLFTDIEVVDQRTGRPYNSRFWNDRYLVETAETRGEYLKRGSEQQAQDALVDMARRAIRHTGGQFYIHPFLGAVNGTKLTPVAPGFLTDLPELDRRIGMTVHVLGIDRPFDGQLTAEQQEIGTTFEVPSAKADRWIRYMEDAKRANPNQSSRDQAIVNNLGGRWDAENARYNGGRGFLSRIRGARPSVPIELVPGNIATLMKRLGAEGLVNSRLSARTQSSLSTDSFPII